MMDRSPPQQFSVFGSGGQRARPVALQRLSSCAPIGTTFRAGELIFEFISCVPIPRDRLDEYHDRGTLVMCFSNPPAWWGVTSALTTQGEAPSIDLDQAASAAPACNQRRRRAGVGAKGRIERELRRLEDSGKPRVSFPETLSRVDSAPVRKGLSALLDDTIASPVKGDEA